MMTRVCCACGEVLGRKPGPDVRTDSICVACARRLYAVEPMTVWKYRIPPEALELPAIAWMPAGARILSVQAQPSGVPGKQDLCAWALVDPSRPPERRAFRVYGTGGDVERPTEELTHLATVQMWGGALVWHVFEIPAENVAGERKRNL